ncbi:Uu.00g146200.m01.CDS01 [Anthostomella pinea]|uniref:Uu.00g146200.m01.CDS01 n=1 Tax=Anthostomella pinea TaxID=933095 RepID=A0AAI8VRU9_9PEZI|nr:Uu.00g146200.m01.CDS01 [Anthostomella pinea]
MTDRSMLWALCLVNLKFNRIYTSYLYQSIIWRAGGHIKEATIDAMVASGYLNLTTRLEVRSNTGPSTVPKTSKSLEKLLRCMPNLIWFKWVSSFGDISSSTLVHLSRHCPKLEDIWCRGGPRRDISLSSPVLKEQLIFPKLKRLTYHGIENWLAMRFLPNLPKPLIFDPRTEEEEQMESAQIRLKKYVQDWIRRQETLRTASSRSCEAPLEVHTCFHRMSEWAPECPVCKSEPSSARERGLYLHTLWPCGSGTAELYVIRGSMEHIKHRFPAAARAAELALDAADEA